MPSKTEPSVELSRELELKRIIPLPEAARLQSTSVDTLKRNHPTKIVRLSPRRLGMRLGDALMITK